MSNATNNSSDSYYQRCVAWLANEAQLSVEALESTIEKFAHQLRTMASAGPELRQDLQATLNLLNEKLAELSPPPGHDIAPATEAAAVVAAVSNPASAPVVDGSATGSDGEELEYHFDPSPLTPLDSGEPNATLTAEEKEAKLAELLSSEALSRGMPTKKKPVPSKR